MLDWNCLRGKMNKVYILLIVCAHISCVLCDDKVGDTLNDAASSLLEIGPSITKADFENFRENAMAKGKAAKDVLAGVQYDGTTFSFQCSTSEKLCAEVTAQSRNMEPTVFSHNGWSFALSGDGQFTKYDVQDPKGRRRLLNLRGRSKSGC